MNEDVNPLKEDGTPKSPEEIEQEKQTRGNSSAPGSKTDPALLLESLKEERAKRKELEDRIALLESSAAPDNSAELETLRSELKERDEKIDELTKGSDKKDLLITYPILSDKWDDFETFVNDPDNAGMSIKTAARVFLTENGLLDQQRKGLEDTRGGDRTPTPTKMTTEEIADLRKNNFKRYQELLSKGLI